MKIKLDLVDGSSFEISIYYGNNFREAVTHIIKQGFIIDVNIIIPATAIVKYTMISAD